MRGGEHVGRVLNDHTQTYAAAVTWHHSDCARPSFSDDEIKDDDDSTHQISPILTHITDYKGGDVYDNWLRWTAELMREQFAALFSADLDASDDDFGGFEPAKYRCYDTQRHVM